MQDSAFGGRVKVACLKYAAYIMDEGPGTAGHTARLRWAQSAFQQPVMAATQVQAPVVMTPEVQQGGAAIEDALLQVAVESVVNKFL